MAFIEDLIDVGVAAVGVATGQYWLVALAVGDYQMRSAKERAKQAFNDAQKDRAQMVRSATEPRKIVYGRARVSGPLVYAESTGAKKEFLHLVIALAGHECDAIETIYFNDVALPAADANGFIQSGAFYRASTAQAEASRTGPGTITLPVTPTRIVGVSYKATGSRTNVGTTWSLAGAVVTVDAPAGAAVTCAYEYDAGTAVVRIKTVMGTATQAAFPDLVAESAGKWTAAHQLKGICALYVRLQFDNDVFGQVGIPNISAVVRGRKILDPRSSTPTVPAWSENPALCAADYLRTVLGVPAAQIPDAELSAEATICDQLIALDGSGTTEKRYTCNGVLSTEATPRDNLDAITEAMAGSAIWVQGRWLLRAGAARSSVLTLTENHLADGAIQINPDLQRNQLINRVVPKYTEPAKTWTVVEAPPVTNATYLSDDGGIDLPSELALDMCTGSLRAQRLAKIQLERSRQGLSVRLNCSLLAYDLAPTDLVALTIGRYGWSSKLFEVIERGYDIGAQQVNLTLRETASAVWDWNYGLATLIDMTPNTSLPNPLSTLSVVAGLSASSGTSTIQVLADGTIIMRALVTWTASTDVFVTSGGRVDLQWSVPGSGVWAQGPVVPGGDTSAYIGPLPNDGLIYIRARAVNAAGRVGPWSVISHVVAGNTAAPTGVSGLSATSIQGGIQFNWNAPTNSDYSYTELRKGASWIAGTPLVGSTPTRSAGNGFVWAWPTPGAYTVWAAHYDTSGNVSASSSVSVTVDSTSLLQTSGLAAGSATEVITAAVTAFTCTKPKHTPDGETWRDNSISITYTPSVNCSVTLMVCGNCSYTPVGTSAWLQGGIYVIGNFAGGKDSFSNFATMTAGSNAMFGVSVSVKFDLTAGVSYTFAFLSFKWAIGDTVTLNNLEMRLEAIKR